MKVLIAYTSKHGTSARCAEMLGEKLMGCCEVDIVDLHKQSALDINDYDVAVLGGSVRFASVSKTLKRFLKQHAEKLQAKDCAIFLCCGYPDNFEDYVKENIPKQLTPSLGFHCFGGELKPKQVKGIDKLLIRAMRNAIVEHDFEESFYEGSLPDILPESIERLADRICGKNGYPPSQA